MGCGEDPVGRLPDGGETIDAADVDAGVTQRQGVGVALASVAQYGHVSVLDDREVGVVVVEELGHG